MFSLQRHLLFALGLSALTFALTSHLALAQSRPAISGDVPGSDGTTLTITGSDFGSGSGIVRIDNAPVTILSWSPTRITVTLPATDGPGSLAITTAQGLSDEIAFSGVERGAYVLHADGSVTAEGSATSYGDLTTIGATSSPAVALVPTRDNRGYWILARDGSVYAFGDATHFGSVSTPLTAVGLAVLPNGTGAYVLSANGQVFPLGDARSYGEPRDPISATAITLTPNGGGYWILGAHGMVYAYGNARRYTIPAPSYTNGTLLRVAGASPVFLVQGGRLHHVASLALLRALGRNPGEVKVVQTLSGLTQGRPLLVPDADGTVIRTGGATYVVEAGSLHPIASIRIRGRDPVAVASLPDNWPLGPTWSGVFPLPQAGSLYQERGQSTVYMVNQGALCPIASAEVFKALGFSWGRVHITDRLPALPLGHPVVGPEPILTNNQTVRQGTKPQVYLDQNGTLRPFPSAAVFRELGFRMASVRSVPSLASLKIGSALDSTTVPTGLSSQNSQAPRGQAVALVPSGNGSGYWILWQNGTIQNAGDAPVLTAPSPSDKGTATAESLAVTPDSGGYAMVLSNGTVLTQGDAQAISASSAQDVAMLAGAPSAPGFLSLAYGSFLPNHTSYQDLLAHPSGLSAILPTWYYPAQNPQTLVWTLGSAPANADVTVAQAHQEGVQVWPMIGSVSVGPYQNPSRIAATVRQIVAAVRQNNYDGVTIDFEPSQDDGLTLAQVSQQYTNFVAALGPALHALGKTLMVDVYAATYPQSPFNYAAIAPYVNYINIMSYGEFDSVTEAGPTQGLGWDASIYQAALNDGVPPAKLVIGLGPYGDYWSFNNSGLDKAAPLGSDGYVSDAAAAALLAANPNITPVFDPAYGSEIFMTNEYVNDAEQWTANPRGQAVAPTLSLSQAADQHRYLAPVQNLQGLLNYILVRYAVENQESPPAYLNLAQDGYFGSATAEAVAQFQKDFGVHGDPSGVYGANTQNALKAVIQQWNLGEYQYWIDDTAALANRLTAVAVPDHLAGVAIWRSPFEGPRYWTTLQAITLIKPAGQ